MAASPTAYLFYGILLDAPAAADLDDDDDYVAVEEALEEAGVRILHFGETPHTRTALAIDRSVVTASAGTAAPVSRLDVGEDWADRLARAGAIVELPPQEPRWYVTSRVSW